MSERAVSQELADTIRRLRSLLAAEFGVDYAFNIMGRGQVVAADNDRLGVVLPKEKQTHEDGSGTG